MKNVKLNLNIEEFKNCYNRNVNSYYNDAKEAYKELRFWRKFEIAFLLSCVLLTMMFLGFPWFVSFEWPELCTILFFLTTTLSFLLYYISYKMKERVREKHRIYGALRLRQKDYEEIMSIEEYYNHWKQDSDDYMELIHNILTDCKYVLLSISFTYHQVENDYTLKIYYSVNNKVNTYKKSLCSEIRTDIEHLAIDLNFNLSQAPWLFIPYAKVDEIEPNVEYYADITELLNCK